MSQDIQALVLGDTHFPFHDLCELGPHLVSALATEGVDARTSTDRDELRSLSASAYEVVIDYTTDSDFADGQLSGLHSFVAGGGGYVGVHAAAALTTTAPPEPGETVGELEAPADTLRELVGGRFLDHPEPAVFAVRIVDSQHPITVGLSDFRVYDEPYRVETDDVRVLARMDHPELGDMPVAWTSSIGEGRTFYTALGHTRRSFEGAPLALLGSGIRWAGRA